MKNELELIHVDSAELVFHGNLNKYGSFRGRVGTPLSILRNAFVLRPGLKEDLVQGEYKLYKNEIIEGRELTEASLHMHLGRGQRIHVVPVAKGSKGKGASIGKTILGAVIAVAAVVGAVYSGGATIGAAMGAEATIAGAGLGLSYGAFATFGAMLMLGGISGLMGVKTKVNSSSSSNDSSTTLSGTTNSSNQGGCKYLIYGRKVRVGSKVVSLGYSAQEWDGSTNNSSGQIDNPSAQSANVEGSFDSILKDGTGSKGKGGGSSSPSESPNNIRSKAVVKIIDLIGQGPGVRPVTGVGPEGAKSIYFNGTPLMSADGTYNFEGVRWQWRDGSIDQEPVSGFPAAEETQTVGTLVQHANPVTQNITSTTATSCRVVIKIPSLWTENTKTGNLEPGPDVGINIAVAEADGPFNTVIADSLSGRKCTSEYERAYVFTLPNTSGNTQEWSIRVSRTTPDSTSANVSSDFYFEYIDSITDHQLIYPGTAYCALEFDSAAFGDSIPDRTYDVTGKDIRVPANYDPISRTFLSTGPGTTAGTWDGVTWKVASAVDDPCWALLDIIASTEYGYGIPESRFGTLESDLYEASQYSAQMVPDGFGGAEPRYSLNVCITQAGDAFKLLMQFAGSFRALAFWTAGGIGVSADLPRDPVMIVTNANVIDGNFSYEGTALSGRHNLVYCPYVNLDNSVAYTDLEPYADDSNIASTGVRTTELDGFGVTSRGLARRFAHWTVDTELYQTQTVTYQCGIDHASLRVGEIIQIADVNMQGASCGGRMPYGVDHIPSTGGYGRAYGKAYGTLYSAGVYSLDRVFNPKEGLQYTFKCIAADGTIMACPIASFEQINPGTETAYTRITLSGNLPQAIPVNSVWVITEPTTDTLPQYRVVSISDKGDGIYQITALLYDPAKYDRVENNAPFNSKTYSNFPDLITSALTPPTNISVYNYTVGDGATTSIRVDLGWTQAADPKILGYTVRAVDQSTGMTYTYDAGNTAQYEINNLSAGTWVFGVCAYGKNNTVSTWVDSGATVVNGSPITPSAPLALTAQGATRKVYVSWNLVTIRNLLHYEVQRAPDNSGMAGDFSTISYISANSFTDDNADLLTPKSTWWYRVRAVDTYGTEGEWSNSVSATTTTLLADDLEEAIADTAKIAQQLQRDIGTPTVVTGDTLPDPSGYPEGSVISFVKNGETLGTLYKVVSGKWNNLVSGIPVDSDGKVAGQTSDLTNIQIAIIQTILEQDKTLTDEQKASLQNAVTNGVADQYVTTILATKIAGGSVLAESITGDKIAANTITTANMKAGSIGTDQLAAKAITADKLAVEELIVDNAQIGHLVVGTDNIQDNAVSKLNVIGPNTLTVGQTPTTFLSYTAQYETIQTILIVLDCNTTVSKLLPGIYLDAYVDNVFVRRYTTIGTGGTTSTSLSFSFLLQQIKSNYVELKASCSSGTLTVIDATMSLLSFAK